MIVELLVDLLAGLVSLIVSATGTAQPPAFVDDLGSGLQTLVNVGASMGGWVPWPIVGGAVAAVASAYAVSLVVKLVRVLVSLFSGGGGSAA